MSWKHMRVLLAAAIAAFPTLAIADSAPKNCSVVFGLSSSPPLASAQITIDYSNVQGTFSGSGSGITCSTTVAGGAVTAQDSCSGDYAACQWGSGRKLVLALLASNSFNGPGEVVTCDFLSAETPAAIDFDVTLDSVSAADGLSAVEPLPYIDISSIDCVAQ